MFSENYDEQVEIDLDNNSAKRNHWSDYIAGTAATLGRLQNLRGANILIHSNVPVGSGLSSSAAIEVAAGVWRVAFSHATGRITPQRHHMAHAGGNIVAHDRIDIGSRCRNARQMRRRHEVGLVAPE